MFSDSLGAPEQTWVFLNVLKCDPMFVNAPIYSYIFLNAPKYSQEFLNSPKRSYYDYADYTYCDDWDSYTAQGEQKFNIWLPLSLTNHTLRWRTTTHRNSSVNRQTGFTRFSSRDRTGKLDMPNKLQTLYMENRKSSHFTTKKKHIMTIMATRVYQGRPIWMPSRTRSARMGMLKCTNLVGDIHHSFGCVM